MLAVLTEANVNIPALLKSGDLECQHQILANSGA